MTLGPRFAALAILAGLISLLFWAIVLPLSGIWLDVGFGGRAATLDDLQQVVAEGPRLERKTAALRSAMAASPALWRVGSIAGTTSDIQARVRAAFDQNGGSVQTTTDQPAAKEHGLWRLGVTIDALVTENALAAALNRLETATPALFVDDLTIEAHRGFGDSGTGPPIMAVHIVVIGYGILP